MRNYSAYTENREERQTETEKDRETDGIPSEHL